MDEKQLKFLNEMIEFLLIYGHQVVLTGLDATGKTTIWEDFKDKGFITHKTIYNNKMEKQGETKFPFPKGTLFDRIDHLEECLHTNIYNDWDSQLFSDCIDSMLKDLVDPIFVILTEPYHYEDWLYKFYQDKGIDYLEYSKMFYSRLKEELLRRDSPYIYQT